MSFPWPSPPLKLAIDPDSAHIFQLGLDLSEAQLAILADSLSPDERERAARFLPADSRRHFIAARGQMREIFAAYLGQKPKEIDFAYSPYGKPFLKKTAQNHPLRFNLSHSAGMGLLAISMGREVGIDLERTDRNIDYANISSRFFSPTEAAVIRDLSLSQQAQAFFNGWTRKEAYIKARGLGLTIPLDSFEVSLLPDDPPRIITSDGTWAVYALEPGPEFTAALVIETPVSSIHCWKWPAFRP